MALLSGFEGTLPGGQVIPSFFLLPPPEAAPGESYKVGQVTYQIIYKEGLK